MSTSAEVRAGDWDALLFDFDGVLADTEHVHHESWNEILKPFGIQFDWPEYQKQCIGIADIMVAKQLQLPMPEAVVARKQAFFRQRLEETPPFSATTIDFIRELARSRQLAVVSSSYRQEVEPPLERCDLRASFQLVVCGNDVANLKPAPDPYLLAAKRLGVRNPLVIEDSPAGIAAGRAAGFQVFEVQHVSTMAAELKAFLRA